MIRSPRHPFAGLLAAALLGCASAPRQAPTAGAERVVVVAATTDVHGRLRGWDYYADAPDTLHSLARAATVIDSLRVAHPASVVLVDAGDLLQGNPLAYVAARVSSDTSSPIVAAMNAMDYDAASVGNHEFNYGVPHLERAVRQAEFPFLAANAWRVDGTRAFPAWRIVERGGIRLAIVGATTPGSMIWDRDNLAGRLVVRDAVPAVRAAVDSVRQAGADVVVVVAHSGLDGGSSYDERTTGVPTENFVGDLARGVPGIDLIVFGHSHREVTDTIVGGAMLLQPRNWARSVGVAELTLRRTGDEWTVVDRRSRTIPTAGRLESPKVLVASDAMHRETVRYVTSPIGSTPVLWRGDSARVRDTPLVDLILEVQRKATGADLASTAAFSLDARLGPGGITVADVARLYPYDNTLRAVRISGGQLREYLEYSARYFRGLGEAGGPVDPGVPGYNFDIVSGVDYTIDLTRPVGQRITRLMRGARAVADTDTFTLALNNYRQTGGGGYAMLHGATVVHDRQEEIRQLLIEEIQRRGTIRPEDYFTPNWRLEPAGAAGAAYDAMHRRVSPGGRDAVSAAPAPIGARPRLRIVSTNDFHGALEPRTDAGGTRRGGAAALASAVTRARAGCMPPDCVSILLDGGDMFQGTPASNLAYGRPVVDVYHALDYSAAALGNHEFDWTVDTLRALMAQAKHAILGANVRYDDGSDVEWIPNDTIVERGALRVGVIGVATVSTPFTTRARNVAGLRFDPPAPIVDSTARALRARGADLVVVIAHAGGFCNAGRECDGEIFDLARTVTEPIDAIVSGHSHSRVTAVVRGIPIVQALSSGRAIGIIDLPVGGDDDRPARVSVLDVLTDSLPATPAVESIVRRAVASVEALVNRPVARLAEPLVKSGEQYPLGHIIADAQRWAGQADVAVMNNGGIRTGVPGGEVTYGSLFEVQPFGNTLYRLEVPGRELRAYLERIVRRDQPRVHVSGLTVVFDTTKSPGRRIVSVTMADGRPLDDGGAYSLVINDFMVTGGDGLGFQELGLTAVPLDLVDLDVLMDYLRSRPQPVQPPRERRLRAVPE